MMNMPSPGSNIGGFRNAPNIIRDEKAANPPTAIQNTIGSYGGSHYTIDHRDSNSLLSVTLDPTTLLRGKPGAMVAMAGTVQIKGKLKFSFKKMVAGGEMSESTFTGPGEVLLAPEIWGDIIPILLDGNTVWNVGRDVYLASLGEVARTIKSQGVSKTLFSGEGLFVSSVSGKGVLFVQSMGAIIKRRLGQGEQWIVDNGHLVAWTAKYTVERIGGGGFMSSSHTGEGMVCRFTGPGEIYIQTRNPEALAEWVSSHVYPPS